MSLHVFFFFFFFNDTATTEIYTLSLHDALPISCPSPRRSRPWARASAPPAESAAQTSTSTSAAGKSRMLRDRKSTRLNSSHDQISYAVFCLKKKKIKFTSPRVTANTEHYGRHSD